MTDLINNLNIEFPEIPNLNLSNITNILKEKGISLREMVRDYKIFNTLQEKYNSLSEKEKEEFKYWKARIIRNREILVYQFGFNKAERLVNFIVFIAVSPLKLIKRTFSNIKNRFSRKKNRKLNEENNQSQIKLGGKRKKTLRKQKIKRIRKHKKTRNKRK